MSEGHLTKALPSRQWSCGSLAAAGRAVRAVKEEVSDHDDAELEEEIQAATTQTLLEDIMLETF